MRNKSGDVVTEHTAGEGSIAEQLAPVAARMRRAHSSVRPVSQVLIAIPANEPDAMFAIVRDEVLRWMRNRAGKPLPKTAWDGESFELADVGAQRAEATLLEDVGYWAARLDDLDTTTPQRFWTSEAAVAKRDDSLLFGARLYCVTRGEDSQFVSSTPGFVRQIVENCGGAIDGRQIGDRPWIVHTMEEAEELVELICNPSRKHDVIAISTHDSSDDPMATLISADNVYSRTLGAAHVAVITATGAFALTNLLGKEFSAFRQAVRTYRPGFDPDQAQPYDHPLALGQRISEWHGGPGAFQIRLIDQCLRATVSRLDLEEQLPPYARAKQIARELRRKARTEAGASDSELLELALDENEQLKKQIEEQSDTYDGLIREMEAELGVAVQAEKEADSRIYGLKARVDYLEHALQTTPSRVQKTPIPDNFQEIEDWAFKHLAGQIVLQNRAIRAARKSPFEDVGLAYRALLILRDLYVPMRLRGGDDLRKAYEDALAIEGLSDEASFGGHRAGEQGDTYYVNFGGRKRELDRHLKGSNSRDPRFGFRLYFLWDDETQQVVVGSLPNHLKTRIT